jgi:hypothetical protein
MADSELPGGLHPLDWYIEQAHVLYERDYDLRKDQERIDKMIHADYEPPPRMRELGWFRNFKSTQPYDGINAGVRVLSVLDDVPTVDPLSVMKALGSDVSPNWDVAKSKANEWERVLKHQGTLADGRQAVNKSDINRSALLYDECIATIVHLPTQIKALKAINADTRKYEYYKQFGQFATIIRRPPDAHVIYSEYGPEVVLSVIPKTTREILYLWGDRVEQLRDLVTNGGVALDAPWLLYDWSDIDARAVWATLGEDEGQAQGEGGTVIEVLREKNPYPFLPWSAVLGGTTLEHEERYKRNPLLQPIVLAESWFTANIIGSLRVSEGLAEFGRPKLVKAGPGSGNIVTRYGTPGGEFIVGPMQDVKLLPKEGLDPALSELYNQFISEMDRATMPRILISSETMPGETYSGYNLRVQTAMGRLMPYKNLGERCMAGLYRLMLLYAHYSKEPLHAYDTDGKSSTYGKEFTIYPGDIDPNYIYIKVDQEADLPIDRLQKINGAVMMARELKVDTETILDELGEKDSQRRVRNWTKEQFKWAYVGAKVKAIDLVESGQMQKMAQEMAQQMVQQMMEQAASQQGAEAAAGGPGSVEGGMGGPQAGMEGSPAGTGMGMEAGGQGMNPGMGGGPPIEAGGEQATFEGATGMMRGGGEA